MNVNLISEKRSGFTGTRDRAKLHRLSTNLRNQGSSEIEIQSHLRDWLQKRGKMHYHGTPYKFEGPPVGVATRLGREGENFLSNAVHVGTRRSAQDRLKTKDLTGRYNPRSLQPISPRIIPLTVNVGKDSHALGSRASSFSDSNASNFGKHNTLTPGSPPLPLELTHTRQHGTPMNNTSYTRMRPRDDQNTVVYRNAVEDKGNISYSTRKPEETLRTLHNLANQNEAYTRKLSKKSKSLLKKLRKVRASSKFSKEIGKYALDAAAAKKTGTEKHPWSAIEAHGLRTKEDNRAATNTKGAEELADNPSELSRIKRMIRHAKGH